MAGSMGMNIWTVVAFVVVATLGLLTVILGVAGTASAAQSVVSDEDIWSCVYQTSPAVGCGVVAALLALMTQIVATAATGCCGFYRSRGIPTEAKRIVAVAFSAFSWVLCIIVVILFMVGAIVSTDRFLVDKSGDKCVPPGTGEFAAATILFIIMVICQIASYILLEVTTVTGSKKPLGQESGIAMGQQTVESLNNADQKVATGGDAPPSVPAVSSDVSVGPPPPASVVTMSPKATDDLASQV